MSKLLLVNDGKRERELLLVERLVVGRDPACDISVDDGLLSRRHAEFISAPTAVLVRDLGSRNGIFVNGQRRAEQSLQPGDVVQIGPLRVRYLLDQPAGTPAARLDADGTLMLPAPPATSPPRIAVAPAPAFDDFDPGDGEGETRVVLSPTPTPAPAPLPQASPAAFADLDEATSFTPTPRPGPMPVAAPSVARAPLVPSIPTPGLAGTRAAAPVLGQFVLIQLGALAVIVFVATVAPIVASRGAVLEGVAEGQLTALLVWPVLPLAIGLTATLVIANAVNRRVLRVLAAGQHHVEGR